MIKMINCDKNDKLSSYRYLTGQVDKRTLEKYEREAKEKNRESWSVSVTLLSDSCVVNGLSSFLVIWGDNPVCNPASGKSSPYSPICTCFDPILLSHSIPASFLPVQSKQDQITYSAPHCNQVMGAFLCRMQRYSCLLKTHF